MRGGEQQEDLSSELCDGQARDFVVIAAKAHVCEVAACYVAVKSDSFYSLSHKTEMVRRINELAAAINATVLRRYKPSTSTPFAFSTSFPDNPNPREQEFWPTPRQFKHSHKSSTFPIAFARHLPSTSKRRTPLIYTGRPDFYPPPSLAPRLSVLEKAQAHIVMIKEQERRPRASVQASNAARRRRREEMGQRSRPAHCSSPMEKDLLYGLIKPVDGEGHTTRPLHDLVLGNSPKGIILITFFVAGNGGAIHQAPNGELFLVRASAPD